MEKASVSVCPDLFFNGMAQATLEKTSMTVSRNLYPSLYLEIDDKSTRSACHKSSIPGCEGYSSFKVLAYGFV